MFHKRCQTRLGKGHFLVSTSVTFHVLLGKPYPHHPPPYMPTWTSYHHHPPLYPSFGYLGGPQNVEGTQRSQIVVQLWCQKKRSCHHPTMLQNIFVPELFPGTKFNLSCQCSFHHKVETYVRMVVIANYLEVNSKKQKEKQEPRYTNSLRYGD